ncbi:hypothetical protein pdam_00025441, partial [Pocillopora damicornis]
MGDFNTNLFDLSQTHNILKMMFQQSGYQQNINEYTTDNRTLLDHIYSNLPLQSTITGVSETYCSYHKGVYIAIDKDAFCCFTMSSGGKKPKSTKNAPPVDVQNYDVVKEQGVRPYYGMAIYSKEIFAYGYPKKNNLHGVEITILKLHDYRNLIIAGIYRSPKVTLQNLYMALSELIDFWAHERYSVIMGDFNTNLFHVSQTHTILKMMFPQSGYQQHINEYTTDNRTVLDHIYSNLPLQSTITGVSETYYSYHKGVYIAIDK